MLVETTFSDYNDISNIFDKDKGLSEKDNPVLSDIDLTNFRYILSKPVQKVFFDTIHTNTEDVDFIADIDYVCYNDILPTYKELFIYEKQLTREDTKKIVYENKELTEFLLNLKDDSQDNNTDLYDLLGYIDENNVDIPIKSISVDSTNLELDIYEESVSLEENDTDLISELELELELDIDDKELELDIYEEPASEEVYNLDIDTTNVTDDTLVDKELEFDIYEESVIEEISTIDNGIEDNLFDTEIDTVENLYDTKYLFENEILTDTNEEFCLETCSKEINLSDSDEEKEENNSEVDSVSDTSSFKDAIDLYDSISVIGMDNTKESDFEDSISELDTILDMSVDTTDDLQEFKDCIQDNEATVKDFNDKINLESELFDDCDFENNLTINMSINDKVSVDRTERTDLGNKLLDLHKEQNEKQVYSDFVDTLKREEPINNRVKVEEKLDLRNYLRKNPYTPIEDVLKIYTKKEVERALMQGKILKKNGTLRSL